MRRIHADDSELLRMAANGDDRAFAEFYRRWLPLVTGYHLRRTRSRELAFDLTAETFTAVVAGLRRFDPDRGAPAGWLFEIAEHKLKDSRRRAKVESSARARFGHRPIVLGSLDLERVDELASLGTTDRLNRLLAQLPVAQRDAILARVLDERSYAEIADEMDCSEAVVRQRVHRGPRPATQTPPSSTSRTGPGPWSTRPPTRAPVGPGIPFQPAARALLSTSFRGRSGSRPRDTRCMRRSTPGRAGERGDRRSASPDSPLARSTSSRSPTAGRSPSGAKATSSGTRRRTDVIGPGFGRSMVPRWADGG